MRIFLIPLKVVIEQALNRLLLISPLPQKLFVRFGAKLDEAT